MSITNKDKIVTKYYSYMKGYNHYTLIDVMNSFSDCNMKGNN